MILFQWLTVPILAIILMMDLRALLVRRPRFRRDRLLRCIIWAGAIATIIDPYLTSMIAMRMGIQRGTDLVMYMFVLSFLGTSFYFYSRTLRLERKMTELVRHIAVQEVTKGPLSVSTVRFGNGVATVGEALTHHDRFESL